MHIVSSNEPVETDSSISLKKKKSMKYIINDQ